MDQLVRTTLILRQFQNQETGQFLYIDENDTQSIDDLETAQEENWKHTRTFATEIKAVEDIE